MRVQSSKTTDDQLMTVRQAARYMHIPVRRVWTLINSGVLPVFSQRKATCKVLLHPKDVAEAWLIEMLLRAEQMDSKRRRSRTRLSLRAMSALTKNPD